ncbi:MAG: hypothetical protein GWN84_17970, partial [Gammaproteobacteria bacterium]|nr:hypothetical protein [Gammaproteobacteria bacterium]NIR84727.1 hypothetical protein [Gammaproteobacteria bacterium]NIU03303.1 hypothetical protein [Gammaproteobacteria bacterium]NIV50795.1 hypothetical protein [Gammaproteobacteria bacterium]NIV76391.1 hypothetical protein [Gammaproteobacteria bacterium]
LVSVTSVAQEKRPDKKVYHITEAGRAALQEALVRTQPRHKVRSEFLVLMYFAHLLPPERLAEVLDRQAEHFEAVRERLTECERQIDSSECGAPAGVRFTLGYGMAMMRAALEYLQTHRGALIEETAAEREEGSGHSAGTAT